MVWGELGAKIWFGERETKASFSMASTVFAQNASLALVACSLLEDENVDRIWQRAPKVLEKVRLPARVEVLAKTPWMIVDSSHTEASVDALLETLARFTLGKEALRSVFFEGKVGCGNASQAGAVC